MLISKKQIKDITIPSTNIQVDETSTKPICLQDGYLYIKCQSGKIEFIKCCLKHNEVLLTMDKDEFSKLNADELHQLIYKAYSIVPEKHDPTVIPACYTKLTYCDYNKFHLKTLGVSISKACNILCRMCWHNLITNEVRFADKDLYFNTLYKCKGMHLEKLELTDCGEPFFYKKETLKFISTITPNDFKTIFIISNVILLNDEDIKLLYDITIKNNIKIEFTVSCSAITEDTYKKIHNNDNFNKVIHNIKLLNQYNLLGCINFVVQEPNIHELDFIYDFWKDEHIYVNISYIRQSHPGITKEEEDRILSIVKSKKYI